MKKTFFLASVLLMSAGTAFASDYAKHHDMKKDGHVQQMADHKMKIMDANKDGKITLAEHDAAAAKMFTDADVNKDKKVSEKELKDSIKTHLSGMNHDKKTPHWKQVDMVARHKMTVVDTNKDGAISEEEHKAAAEKMFTEADADKNKEISAAELNASVKQHFAAMHEEHKKHRIEKMANHKLQMMDANKDGAVSLDEHKAAMEKKFMEADTNKDNSLSKEEIAHGVSKHMEMKHSNMKEKNPGYNKQ